MFIKRYQSLISNIITINIVVKVLFDNHLLLKSSIIQYKS